MKERKLSFCKLLITYRKRTGREDLISIYKKIYVFQLSPTSSTNKTCFHFHASLEIMRVISKFIDSCLLKIGCALLIFFYAYALTIEKGLASVRNRSRRIRILFVQRGFTQKMN